MISFDHVNIIGNRQSTNNNFFTLTSTVYLNHCTIADNSFFGYMFATSYSEGAVYFIECTVSQSASQVFQITKGTINTESLTPQTSFVNQLDCLETFLCEARYDQTYVAPTPKTPEPQEPTEAPEKPKTPTPQKPSENPKTPTEKPKTPTPNTKTPTHNTQTKSPTKSTPTKNQNTKEPTIPLTHNPTKDDEGGLVGGQIFGLIVCVGLCGFAFFAVVVATIRDRFCSQSNKENSCESCSSSNDNNENIDNNNNYNNDYFTGQDNQQDNTQFDYSNYYAPELSN